MNDHKERIIWHLAFIIAFGGVLHLGKIEGAACKGNTVNDGRNAIDSFLVEAADSLFPTTSKPTTEITTTARSETGISTTERNETGISTTERSETEISTTERSETEISTTEISETEISTTERSKTEISTTERSKTENSTTERSETEIGTTERSETEIGTTESETEISTTERSETEISTTERSETEPPQPEGPRCAKAYKAEKERQKELYEYYSVRYSFLGEKVLMNLIGDFSPPSCDAKGYYKPVQCNLAGCYCVDPVTGEAKKFTKDSRQVLTPEDCED